MVPRGFVGALGTPCLSQDRVCYDFSPGFLLYTIECVYHPGVLFCGLGVVQMGYILHPARAAEIVVPPKWTPV